MDGEEEEERERGANQIKGGRRRESRGKRACFATPTPKITLASSPLSPPFPVFRSPFAFSSLLPTRFIFLARYDPRAFRSLNDLRYSCHFRFIHRL